MDFKSIKRNQHSVPSLWCYLIAFGIYYLLLKDTAKLSHFMIGCCISEMIACANYFFLLYKDCLKCTQFIVSNSEYVDPPIIEINAATGYVYRCIRDIENYNFIDTNHFIKMLLRFILVHIIFYILYFYMLIQIDFNIQNLFYPIIFIIIFTASCISGKYLVKFFTQADRLKRIINNISYSNKNKILNNETTKRND